MVLPGWNVSEPIQLAFKLGDVIKALKDAPDEAKAFLKKVNGFNRSLQSLQPVLKNHAQSSFSTQDFDNLQATLVDCQECVARCEQFSKSFKDLTGDGKGAMASAGQRVRLVWQEKKVAKLAAEIDDQMLAIQFCLTIRTLSVFWRSPAPNDAFLTDNTQSGWPEPPRIGHGISYHWLQPSPSCWYG